MSDRLGRNRAASLLVLWVFGSPGLLRAAEVEPLDEPRFTIHREDVECSEVFQWLADGLEVELDRDERVQCGKELLRAQEESARSILDDLCAKAGCTWNLEDDVLRVHLAGDESATESVRLEGEVTIQVPGPTPVAAILRVLEEVLDADVVVDEGLQAEVTLHHDGTAATLLDEICRQAGCTWVLEEPEGRRAVLRVDRSPESGSEP